MYLKCRHQQVTLIALKFKIALVVNSEVISNSVKIYIDENLGTCIDVCQYDGLKMLPGTEITNDGKCRRLRCTDNFAVAISR